MEITVKIDTDNAEELALLTALLGTAEETTPAPKKVAAKKAAAKAVEPEPEESGEPTLADAVALASKLVSSGKAAMVKAALADLGAARVSELEEGQVAPFIETLSE